MKQRKNIYIYRGSIGRRRTMGKWTVQLGADDERNKRSAKTLEELGYSTAATSVQTTIEPSSVKAGALRGADAVAMAPAKSLFMTGFMLWMTGSGVHLFSIMIVGMSLFNPIKAIMAVNTTFKRFELPGVNLAGAKLKFIAIQIVALGMGIWKLNKMGLLPVTSADWMATMITVKTQNEFSG